MIVRLQYCMVIWGNSPTQMTRDLSTDRQMQQGHWARDAYEYPCPPHSIMITGALEGCLDKETDSTAAPDLDV